MAIDRADWHSGAADFPSELPPENGGTHIGIYLAWVILHSLESMSLRRTSAKALARVRAREMTGREFFFAECDGKLVHEDLSEEGKAFTAYYYESSRNESATTGFFPDYGASLGDLSRAYFVADIWANYDRFEPYATAAYERWKAEGRPTPRTLRVLEKELLKELGRRFRSMGFSGRVSEGLRRRFALGSQSVDFYTTESVELLLRLYLRVRFDDVERLIHPCQRMMLEEDLARPLNLDLPPGVELPKGALKGMVITEREAERTSTIMDQLGKVHDSRCRDWDLSLDANVSEVANEVAERFREIGLPFFERFSSLASAYEVLRKEDTESLRHSVLRLGGAERAVALAWLLGGSSEALRTIEAKKIALASLPVWVGTSELERFERFVVAFQRLHMS